MARPTKKYPSPGKRCRSGRWRIYWRSGDSTYEFSVGDVSETEAENKRLGVELALRSGDWPEWAAGTSAVRRYRQGDNGGTEDIMGEYEGPLRREVSKDWATASLAYVRELRDWVDGELYDVSPGDAQGFLEHVLATPPPFLGKNLPDSEREPRKPSTRNRMLAACRRFYGWAVQRGYVDRNPFDGISQLNETKTDDIVYCTRDERSEILEAADAYGDGVAVWMAFYAGMRRGEIWQATWEDVSLERRRIRTRGKTGPRVIPLADRLVRVLQQRGKSGKFIVPRECTWQHCANRCVERLRSDTSDIPNKRIRWNAWRHTFGSLLAQDGVSIDKISAWMGNTPEVCRRHYARFVPRDKHDQDIEKL